MSFHPLAGKVEGHIEKIRLLHPLQTGETSYRFQRVVSLEMGAETNPGGRSFPGYAGDVADCLLPVQEQGGPLNIVGPKHGKRQVHRFLLLQGMLIIAFPGDHSNVMLASFPIHLYNAICSSRYLVYASGVL